MMLEKRLDVFLSEKLTNITRSNIKKIINSNRVKINNLVVRSQSKKIKLGDKIVTDLIQNSPTNIIPSKKRLK